MYNRMAAAGLLFTALMLLFVMRLGWLQIWPEQPPFHEPGTAARDGWKRLSVAQRQRGLVLDTGRGDFVDRYGRAITGETYWAPAFFPLAGERRGDSSSLAELAALLGTPQERLERFWDGLETGSFWQSEGELRPYRLSDIQKERLEALKLDGVRALPYRNRYIGQFGAKHWIGFTGEHPEWLLEKKRKALQEGRRKLSEQVGGYGLEKSLDDLLHGIGETSVSYFIDGRSNPLHGLDLRLSRPDNGYYPLQAVTTIDLELQNKIEAYLDRQSFAEGAVVVLDAANADIVSMISRPQLKPGQFRKADGSEWTNYALKAVEPGSIFKLVTAAAALEYRAVQGRERFHCSGEYGRYGLSCWKRGGHGSITMLEGLAQSCNIVFAALSERVGGRALERTAEALGLEGRIGWHSNKAIAPLGRPLRLLEEEEPGRIFASASRRKQGDVVDGGVLAQTGIGQRDVRMTPLHAANLIVTLLHGGKAMEPRIVSEIRYADNSTMLKLPVKRANSRKGKISGATARTLLRGMEAVVDQGTGRSIAQGHWKVAGKSGTAETRKQGKSRNHQWFIGYGPVAAPRYAVAVLVANRQPGSAHQATLLFRGIMDLAAEHEAAIRDSLDDGNRKAGERTAI